MVKVIGGVAVVMFLIGVFFIWQGKQVTAPGGTRESGTMKSTEVPETAMEQGKKVITSIKEAMGLGTQMKCSFATGEGSEAVTSTVYVAGSQFFVQGTAGGVTTYALFDGATQYVWTDQNTQGMKMDQACLESFKGGATDVVPQDYRDDFDMAKNVSCEPVETTPIAMSIPKDVIFTDQCAMMQESLQMMEKMKNQLPAGMNISDIPNVSY